MKSFRLQSKKERISKSKNNIFSWTIHPDDLKNQVENYHSLGFFQSYRKIASILPLWLVISAILSVNSDASNLPLIIPFIILYFVLLFFTYKGSRWSIILLIIIFTFEMIYKEIEGFQVLNKFRLYPIVLWFLIMPVLLKTLKVENRRKKFDKNNQ